jgi:transcriptional regulator with XRE-family HTH domain
MDVGVPFVVRRARLLMGMTQAEFAELFEVDDGTVSRWERGKLRPAPKVWKRIREITLREDSLRDEALVRASPVYKYLVDIKRLTKPMVASRGISEATADLLGRDSSDHRPRLQRRSPFGQRFPWRLRDDGALLRLAGHRWVNIGAICLNLLYRSSDAQIDAWIAVAQ